MRPNMRPIKNFKSATTSWKMALGGAVAVMVFSVAPASLAQNNQSDVTGSNLSDLGGSNLSDLGFPSAVLGVQISSDGGGNSVPLTTAVKQFVDQFGGELGIDPNADLSDQFAQVRAACTPQPNEGDRRFALNPRPANISNTTNAPACTQFSQLVQAVRDALDQYQNNGPANAIQGRPW